MVNDSIVESKLKDYIRDIKKRRINLNLSQLKLAKVSNLSQSIIAKLEAGKIIPNFSTTIKLEEALSNLENVSGLKAKDIMIKDVIIIHKNFLISDALKIMVDNDYSQLLVVENDILIGVLDERTIIDAISKKINFEEKTVKEILDINPILIPREYSISDLTFIFQNKNTSFVVVFENNKIEGIITKYDLFKS